MNIINNDTNLIESTIVERKELWDKNGKKYLILELESGDVIFVFDPKVEEDKWEWLQKDRLIIFEVEEGKKDTGSKLLVNYTIKT
ncbi:hypothetical protein [endosymbiont GvMRE of Glomus versiforme]|uniref:hypothetical protein n=1 Tax=endosymbiont GvMRE of Glomus versiforme TaxID=2039283 RepID=UPI000EBD0AC0|nr:hypothetical protein [endosymbiont GvMRE of Glomus versiforme]RHZ35700.1 hypothetical protein GvMRE_IIg106 [endosymbiont GvMRE of Glomus versiforme]